MDRHPGGEAHSRHMIELAGLPAGAKVLDMGAGAGELTALLRGAGYDARGIDLQPRGEGVEQGDFLHCPWADASFDAVFSQCAFYAGGDVPGALKEAWRLLKTGGVLVLSDVCPRDEDLAQTARAAGFEVLRCEDLTESWKQYYIQLLWEGKIAPMSRDRKFGYILLLCRKR